MVAYVDSGILADALNAAKKLINTKTEGFNLVCLEFDEQMTVTSGSGVTEFSMSVDCKVDGMERLFVAPEAIVALIAKSERQIIEMSYEKMVLTIKTSHGVYNIACTEDEKFGLISRPGNTDKFELDFGLLRKGIASVAFAQSTDEMRAILCGVLIESATDGVRFVATNSRILATQKRNTERELPEFKVFLPSKVVEMIPLMAKFVSDDTVCTIEYTSEFVSISVGKYEVCSSLVLGDFPPYQRILPAGFVNNEPRTNLSTIVVDRKPLSDALKRSRIFANNTNYLTKITANMTGMELDTEDSERQRKSNESVKSEADGKSFFGIDSVLMKSIVDSFESETLAIYDYGESRAIIVCPTEEPDECQTVCIIMPIMLSA